MGSPMTINKPVMRKFFNVVEVVQEPLKFFVHASAAAVEAPYFNLKQVK